MSEILPAIEAEQLAACEQVIERGLKTFVEVGSALLAIRDGRLYRATHAAFDDYCRERWQFGRDYADRMITAAAVVPTIVSNGLPAPANEGQARELARIADEAERANVWGETLQCTDGKPTAAAIREARAVLQAHREVVNERRAAELAANQRKIDEARAASSEGQGWKHAQWPITLGAKLGVIADNVHDCRPRLVHNSGQSGYTSAWGFGHINWRDIDDLMSRTSVPALGKAKADLQAAIAAYSAELDAAVKRAAATVRTIEADLRAAVADTSDVVIATQHDYRRPLATGWLVHGQTEWHERESAA